MAGFKEELRCLINKRSREQRSNTPDYVLADYLCGCMTEYEAAVIERDKHLPRATPIVLESAKPSVNKRYATALHDAFLLGIRVANESFSVRCDSFKKFEKRLNAQGHSA